MALTGKTENEVLAAMKTLVIREENIMVARVTLHNISKIKVNQFMFMGLDLESRQVYVD